jgi:hypothetical protein
MGQLVSYFVMAKNYKTALLATKSMLKGEMGVTTITLE